MMLARLDDVGRPVCGAHDYTDPVTGLQRFPVADVDPADPNRCVCRECKVVYETPPSVVGRILWHVICASVRTPYTLARQAIADVMSGEGAPE